MYQDFAIHPVLQGGQEGGRQQAAGSRRQAAGSRQQAAGSRQQAAAAAETRCLASTG